MPYVYLVIAIVAEVIGTTMLKSTDGFRRIGLSLLVLLVYGISFFFLARVLQGNAIPVGVAYATWSGVGMILIATLAFVVHGQKLDLAAVAGIALVVAGVLVLNVFSKVEVH